VLTSILASIVLLIAGVVVASWGVGIVGICLFSWGASGRNRYAVYAVVWLAVSGGIIWLAYSTSPFRVVVTASSIQEGKAQ
jgi:hypothetical protein